MYSSDDDDFQQSDDNEKEDSDEDYAPIVHDYMEVYSEHQKREIKSSQCASGNSTLLIV